MPHLDTFATGDWDLDAVLALVDLRHVETLLLDNVSTAKVTKDKRQYLMCADARHPKLLQTSM